ncbi:unnamed protein product [Didymodactylos carnosus]|uniref:Uncharacterized protein n=1 Tax=Didymodactylos carnosus TaxID=1234261 RepID=A0A816DGG5_9BILA|nr:unnamed protein product [Didymodactylos carnosus]CAF4544180.1 unnamed protein product [Didymodactylos carnosus]
MTFEVHEQMQEEEEEEVAGGQNIDSLKNDDEDEESDVWNDLEREMFGGSTDKDVEENIPLYPGASVFRTAYHEQIIKFCAQARLDRSNTQRLLQLIALALPNGHNLVKSESKLMGIIKKPPSFTEQLLCAKCDRPLSDSNKCALFCELNGKTHVVQDTIEIVKATEDQIRQVIRRNKHLIHSYPYVHKHYLPCDILNGKIYEEKSLQKHDNVHPVNLILHLDGAPIVKWTQKQTWIFSASILEIPPPLRENATNLI